MWKEIIICIVIVTAIIGGNILTQNYTVESVENLSGKLSELKKDVLEIEEKGGNKDSVNEKMQEIEHEWNKRHDKLAYFIEHDELEKVETNLTGANSFLKTGEYIEAISELDKSNFILKHIEEKYAFNLENIF